jgi:hypothetical protein
MMPLENTVFLDKDSMLSPMQWQESINAAGFDVQFTSEFDVYDFEGFVNATLEGRKAGFEYYFEAIEEDMLDAELKTQIAGKTHIVTLVTHSDLDKTRSSCLAAAVLCKAVKGYLWDGDEECLYSADDCAGWLQGQAGLL